MTDNQTYSGEPLIEITHLRPVDDAGTVHYEGTFTGDWIDEAERDGVLRLEGNIRPDWQPGGKPGAKTKRKVDRWAEELLKNNAVMGNLSVRLNPDTAKYEFTRDDEGDFTLRLFAGHLDTGVDSQSRFTAILKASRSDAGTMKGSTRFSVRIWMANDDLAARVGSDYNTRGDKVNDTAAKFAYQDNAHKRLARLLLEGSPHLGVDNIEVLTNTVSASSSKLVAFNTLTQAMENYWSGDPINTTEETGAVPRRLLGRPRHGAPRVRTARQERPPGPARSVDGWHCTLHPRRDRRRGRDLPSGPGRHQGPRAPRRARLRRRTRD